MKALSLRAGLSESAVRDILNRGHSPNIDTLVALADALGVSPVWLLEGSEKPRLKIPAVGIASSDEVWAPADAKSSAIFDVVGPGQDLVSVRVEGNGLSPTYRHGDELLCRRHSGGFIDNLIGLDCLLMTADGERYIKILARGSSPGLFNLRSFNPLVRDIENVAVAWAAPVLMVKRADYLVAN